MWLACTWAVLMAGVALSACETTPADGVERGVLQLQVDADFCAAADPWPGPDAACGHGVGDAVWDVRVEHFEPYEDDEVTALRLRRSAAPNPDASAGVAVALACRTASDRGGNRVTVRLVGLYAAPLEDAGAYGEPAPAGAIAISEEPRDHVVVFACPPTPAVTLHVNESIREAPWWSWSGGLEMLRITIDTGYPGWPGCRTCAYTPVWDTELSGSAPSWGADSASLRLTRSVYGEQEVSCAISPGGDVVGSVALDLVGVYRGLLPYDADLGAAGGPGPEGALPVVVPARIELPATCAPEVGGAVAIWAELMAAPEPDPEAGPAVVRFGAFRCAPSARACPGAGADGATATLTWACLAEADAAWFSSLSEVTVGCPGRSAARLDPTTAAVLTDPDGLIFGAEVVAGATPGDPDGAATETWQIALTLTADAPPGCVVAASASAHPGWAATASSPGTVAYPRIDWAVPIDPSAAACVASDLLTADGALTAAYSHATSPAATVLDHRP